MIAELVVAFAAGTTAGWLVGRRRAAVDGSAAPSPDADTSSSSSDASPAVDPTSPARRLRQLGEALNTVGEASAHPRDLLESPAFADAVRILATGPLPVSEVADYATGANWVLAAAGCAALAERPDRAAATDAVVTRLPFMRPWTLYYALRYFESLETPPPVGAVMLGAQEWWGDHPFVPTMLAEHFAFRAGRGDGAEFGDALTRATPAGITEAETVLKRIVHPLATGLLEAITAFRRSRLDREFLQTVGRFVEGETERAILVEHDAIRDQLAHAEACLAQTPPRSLLVIGEPRSGKSSFLALLAGRAERAGWTWFEAGGAQLQAGQTYIGELEERLRRLMQELSVEKRVLWHAPDLLQLATSGTHKGQSATILDQVLPAVAAGRIVLLSEITPSALTTVLQARPVVRTAVDLVRLRPLSDPETERLAGDAAVRLAEQAAVRIEPEVLATTTYLATHYLGPGGMPGAALDLLKLAVGRAVSHDASAVGRDDVLATTTQLTGMPRQVLDDRERVDLSALRGFFTARVIGQEEAVEAIVNRIAMLKAGLTDPGKPIGVFLFAGPTGTGKTELAKTLAAFLFGSPERLLRLDMSEFQSAESLRKIVGDPDAAGDGHALTDRVRKAPFSVVLLDEFEKAHANVWDLFLQVFDDGRLSDARGQVVDFRHCIIILTSNLGSTVRQDAATGFIAQAAAFAPQQVMKAINRSFRPEFVNRLDRVLVFRPLGREQMRSIVAKELARVLERRGLRHREWAVEWEASALDFLLDKGFSPALGARPLKRAIDDHLLAPLAATLVEHRAPEGDQFLFVRSDGRALQVEFVDPEAPPSVVEEPAADAADARLTLGRLMLHPAGTAEERLSLHAAITRLEARLSDDRWSALQAGLAARMQRPDFWDTPERQAVLSRFELMDRVSAALRTARSLAGRLDRSASVSGRYSRELVSRLASQLFLLEHGIDDALDDDAPVEIVIAIEPVLDRTIDATAGERWCEQLGGMYRQWATRRGMHLDDVPAPRSHTPLLVVSGFGAARLLAGEVGLHVLDFGERDEAGRAIARVIVRPTPATLPDAPKERAAVLSQVLAEGTPPSVVVRRYRISPSPVVRDVRQGWRTGRADLVLGGHFDIVGELMPAAVDDRRG